MAVAAEPTFYVCQLPGRRQTLAIATSIDDPTALIPDVRAALQAENANVPIQFDTLPDVVSSSLSRQRLGMLLMQLFAAAALVLAAVLGGAGWGPDRGSEIIDDAYSRGEITLDDLKKKNAS